MKTKQVKREKAIPQYKIDIVERLSNEMKGSSTVMIVSTNKLPSSQFHDIKKKLRGKAKINVAKKSLVIRAIENTKKESMQSLKNSVVADVAIFFSKIDPFELSGLLEENKSPSRAKTGDVAPEDIRVEPGPTDLVPGPAISELSGVGLKVAVEGGKLAIKQPATIVKKGEKIKENVASVMAKLGIMPMKVGFEPLAAYSSEDEKVYTGIKIDKKASLDLLRDYTSKSKGFAVNINYVCKDNVSYFIAKASMQEKALNAASEKNSQNSGGAQ